MILCEPVPPQPHHFRFGIGYVQSASFRPAGPGVCIFRGFASAFRGTPSYSVDPLFDSESVHGGCGKPGPLREPESANGRGQRECQLNLRGKALQRRQRQFQPPQNASPRTAGVPSRAGDARPVHALCDRPLGRLRRGKARNHSREGRLGLRAVRAGERGISVGEDAATARERQHHLRVAVVRPSGQQWPTKCPDLRG